MKRYILFIFLLSVFALIAIAVEKADVLSVAKKSLRNRDLPSPLLNFGKRGQILKEMGLKYVASPDEDRTYGDQSRIRLDLSRLDTKEGWVDVDKQPAEKLLSTALIDPAVIKSGFPVLSIYIDEKDLYDKYTGISANPLEKGRNWERPSLISWFNEGELLFGTGAGVRIHGGRSRLHPLKSFRLYFRPVYGKGYFGEGLLFKGEGDPLAQVVVRKADEEYGFVNSMAFEISRKLGCYAPFTEPARFYVNGKPNGHGNFELIEYLSKDYLVSHFGHKDFVFYKHKGRKDRPSEYNKFHSWARQPDQLITFQTVSEFVDIEKFTNNWIANIFCANTDCSQGIALLDKTKKDPKWFWLMWDMDHSFRNNYEKDKAHLWEQEMPVSTIYSRPSRREEPRHVLLRYLLLGDEKYRQYFIKQLTEAINYKLTREFLLSIADYYASYTEKFGMDIEKNNKEVREYMIKRPEFVMRLMDKYFKLGKVCRVEFTIPRGAAVEIEDYPVLNSFTGYYYDGYTITLLDKKGTVKDWKVNGKEMRSPTIDLRISGNMKIDPVY